MANKIQGRYDELEGIVRTFSEIGEDTRKLHETVHRCVETLHNGDWVGVGANAFYAELDQLVFPGLDRLKNALDKGASTTRQLIHIFQQAEDEAAKVFQDLPAPTPAPKPSGNPGDGLTKEGAANNLFKDGHFDGKRATYTTGTPTEVANHPFRSGAATALKYEVDINGKKVNVYVPKTPDAANGKFHTIDQIAKGLAALPEASRNVVKEVTMEPNVNPDDAFWQKKYNNPNHRSYMTAGADGIVNIYPAPHTPGQAAMDSSMIHETGHILSKQAWGSDYQGDKWKPWRDAMAADKNSVSAYSHTSGSPGEDFSEALLVYQGYKGTPQEAAMKAKFGNRFALIEKLLNPDAGTGGKK